MVTRNIQFVAHEHYHVFNRGNSKQKIFIQASDYQRFIQLLYLCNTTARFNYRDILKSSDSIFTIERPDQLVHIHAVCLMPNHYHLCLTPQTDEGVGIFMLKLGTAYSMYFNTKYERSGSLFEGRYKAKHADEDTYLKYLFSYIHLNPLALLKDKLATQTKQFEFVSQYPYSSLAHYLPNTTQHPSPRAALGLGIAQVIETDLFNMYFAGTGSSNQSVQRELFDWISFPDGDLNPALGQP